ncbi:MAG TPA: helix-turn-helix domain-containing protein [Planctomycetaceae bacterium]|jgi:hypothetical protein|nr:helix-turn-helix domain-containing protein [Planctomycetaceae bacterium]
MSRHFYLRPAGAAQLLGLTDRQLTSLVRRQLIPHITLPTGQLLFDEQDLAQWVATLKAKPKRAPRVSQLACTS